MMGGKMVEPPALFCWFNLGRHVPQDHLLC
jgi:hypothetical protein